MMKKKPDGITRSEAGGGREDVTAGYDAEIHIFNLGAFPKKREPQGDLQRGLALPERGCRRKAGEERGDL